MLEIIRFSGPSKNQLKFNSISKARANRKTNEMKWSTAGHLFLLTNGAGRVKILRWPSLELIYTLDAHASSCYSLDFDPRGRSRYLSIRTLIVDI
jgi:hypothetical protein